MKKVNGVRKGHLAGSVKGQPYNGADTMLNSPIGNDVTISG